ncbi:MAG TPA: cupin domain-containing protein [Woeseiaceae bacterium]|nr:cupin domain-containing protein [Woeseiaceae bacterium]
MIRTREPLPCRRAIIALLFLATAFSVRASSSALPDPLVAGWQGQPVCELLHEDIAQRILRCTFPPGVGHERHRHVPHFGYAVSGGRMRIVDEKGVREVDLASGSSYASDGVAWHEVLNIGNTTVVYLIIETR